MITKFQLFSVLALIAAYEGIGMALPPELPTIPAHASLVGFIAIIGLGISGGLVFRWNTHNDHNPNLPLNNAARYLTSTATVRQVQLRHWARATGAQAQTVPPEILNIVNTDTIMANPIQATLTFAARWQILWDHYNALIQYGRIVITNWRENRAFMQTLIQDDTRPADAEPDPALRNAVQNYVMELSRYHVNVDMEDFSKTSRSTRAIRTLVAEFRERVKTMFGFENDNFTLELFLTELDGLLKEFYDLYGTAIGTIPNFRQNLEDGLMMLRNGILNQPQLESYSGIINRLNDFRQRLAQQLDESRGTIESFLDKIGALHDQLKAETQQESSSLAAAVFNASQLRQKISVMFQTGHSGLSLQDILNQGKQAIARIRQITPDSSDIIKGTQTILHNILTISPMLSDMTPNLPNITESIMKVKNQCGEISNSSSTIQEAVDSIQRSNATISAALGIDPSKIEENTQQLEFVDLELKRITGQFQNSLTQNKEYLNELLDHFANMVGTSQKNFRNVGNQCKAFMTTMRSTLPMSMDPTTLDNIAMGVKAYQNIIERMVTSLPGTVSVENDWQRIAAMVNVRLDVALQLEIASQHEISGSGKDAEIMIQAIKGGARKDTTPKPGVSFATNWTGLAQQIGSLRPTQPTTESEFIQMIKQDFVRKGTAPALSSSPLPGLEAMTAAITALANHSTEKANLWSCEDKCPLPSFSGGECNKFIIWEKAVQREAATIWHNDSGDFKEKAMTKMGKALCDKADGWFHANQAEARVSMKDATTFGEALQAIMNLIGKEFGVDREEIALKAREAFECGPIQGACWGDYWLEFEDLRERAQIAKTDTIVKTRLLRTIPLDKKNMLETFALSRDPINGKAANLELETIKALLSRQWRYQQKQPERKKCESDCPSGLPDEYCPCPKTRTQAPLSSQRSFSPSCNEHKQMDPHIWEVVWKMARSLGVRRGEKSAAWARWTQERGLCEDCWHIKNEHNFRNALPGMEQAPSRETTREPTRTPSESPDPLA